MIKFYFDLITKINNKIYNSGEIYALFKNKLLFTVNLRIMLLIILF